jgi:hypothetical protein
MAIPSTVYSDARPSRDGRMRANCPFCAERFGKQDSRRSLRIWQGSGWYSCYRCHARGFADDAMRARFAARPVRPSNERRGPPPGFYALAGNEKAETLAEAWRYVRGRRLSPGVVEAAGVGACVYGRYAGRVVVPIRGEDGTWHGFSARALNPEARLKYLYPSWMERAGMLYRAEVLRDPTRADAPVYAVEGVFDALALWPDAVAFLGSPSPAQVEELAGTDRPVVVLLDGDAHEEGWGLAMLLRVSGVRAGAVRLPARTDPDEVPRDELERAARTALESPNAEASLR